MSKCADSPIAQPSMKVTFRFSSPLLQASLGTIFSAAVETEAVAALSNVGPASRAVGISGEGEASRVIEPALGRVEASRK